MPLIPWDNKFELGINEIDEQHKKMLSIINRAYDIFENKKHEDQSELNQLIKEMTDYADYHFETEEKYFKLYGYEKMESHIEVHNQYRTKIEDWQRQYNENKDVSLFFEISKYLQDWWIWHINNTDRDYVPFMKANHIK